MQISRHSRLSYLTAAALSLGHIPYWAVQAFNNPPVDIGWIDPKAPIPGPTGHPKGRKFGDSPRFKVRRKKRH